MFASPHCAVALRGTVSLYTLVRCVQFSPNILELHVSGCCKHSEYDLAEFGLVLQDLSRLQALSLEVLYIYVYIYVYVYIYLYI